MPVIIVSMSQGHAWSNDTFFSQFSINIDVWLHSTLDHTIFVSLMTFMTSKLLKEMSLPLQLWTICSHLCFL